MLESLMLSSRKSGGADDQPNLLFGDDQMGYYGVVSSKFMTGDDLASQISLTKGVAKDSDAGWFKFAYKGKTLYVAKKPFRSNLSWQDLYLNGSVYGDDTNGAFPSGGNRLQNRRVTIGSRQYRVRLLRGGNTDPYSPYVAPVAEVGDLFHKVLALKEGPWASFTMEEVGQKDNAMPGCWAWVIESSSALANTRLFTIPNGGLSMDYSTGLGGTYGWRPVLELVE